MDINRREAHMSIIYSCNFCGETIDREAPFVTLNGNGDRSDGFWKTGYVGHYHAEPTVGCWDRVLELLRAAEEWAPKISSIPTATPQSIAARRRKHQRVIEPTDGDAAADGDGELRSGGASANDT